MTTSSPLRATQRQVAPGVLVVDLAGDINREAEAPLNQVLPAAAVGPDPKLLVLNFADVAYINTTGIALIIGLLAKARQQQCTVSAFGLSDHYMEIFDITRLSDFISIYPDEATALSAQDWSSQ